MGSRFNYETNKPAVVVTTFVLLVSVVLSVSARLGTKYGSFRKLTHDDLAIIASLLFAILQDVCIALAVDSGYGDHQTDVSDGDLDQIMKKLFAASFFYILSLLLSKLSLVLFVQSVTPSIRDKWIARAVKAILLAWATVVIFGTAFQCSVPHTWDIWNGQCFNLFAWRYFVAASNIATDLLIIAQILVLIINIQTSISRRLTFFGIFAPRIFVVIAAMVELILLRQSTYTNDQTYRMYDLTIISVVIQCVSIVTASWPQLMPFLSWMQSNGLRLNNAQEKSSWSYNMTVQSQIQTISQDRKSKSRRAFASTVRRDQILVTQEWDVQSQSSAARIIREEEDELSHGSMQGSSDRSS
ncbi:uncharacterized protein TRUGW13939_08157 [Talaromyces rugulosus]|uniref:Rhodopsin domain-containing protein n=1 Tax=Talaromyces rugulosus TaxID=121627 RepID=A0A7H8R5P7_TALRU|nr:uncharacterized protein TRUGW13939_08157 [Talaromyces rugulosus]QKX61011.1 hypothetical protein TRUGW13939_08157 [Talaromyces rugulosus]